MATIDILVEEQKLQRITVPLRKGETHERLIYGLPEMLRWMREDVPKMPCGRLNAAQSPAEQLDYILYRWIAGKPIIFRKQLSDLMPMSDEVWEFKTPDTRVFGWMYRERVFIATHGGYADHYKVPTKKRLYADDRQEVVRQRDALDIDPPKFKGGLFDDLVRV
jgi:hypothetical protein